MTNSDEYTLYKKHRVNVGNSVPFILANTRDNILDNVREILLKVLRLCTVYRLFAN